MIVGRPAVDTSIFRPLSGPWRALATMAGWRSKPSDARCPRWLWRRGFGAIYSRRRPGLSPRIQDHSQRLGRSL